MLTIGRRQGQSVVLVDGDGRQMHVKVTHLIRETGYLSLHIYTDRNQYAVTLAPRQFLPIGPSHDFNVDIEIHNDESGPVLDRDARLAFDMPPSVQLFRAEILHRQAATGVLQ